jgi:hypothetical protein
MNGYNTYQGCQLDQLQELHFRRQHSARMLKFAILKYHSILTDKHLTELVQMALTTYQPNFKKLAAYPELKEIK